MTTTTVQNEYEAKARAAKVAKLVQVLDQIITLPSHIDIIEECWSEGEWTMAARAAGVRLPSPTTRIHVINVLRLRHLPSPIPQPDDPFEGLDDDESGWL